MTAGIHSATGLAVLSLIAGACTNRSDPVAKPAASSPAEVIVAAIQFHSVMGDVQRNVGRIETIVARAAKQGARICVLPECAVSGYADMTNDVFWSTDDEDVHRLVKELGEVDTDIILDCVAWYGPNSEGWFSTKLAWMVEEAGTHLVLANWTFPEDPGWSGYGLSRVISPEGETIARCASDLGDEIVLATVPVRRRSASGAARHKTAPQTPKRSGTAIIDGNAPASAGAAPPTD